MAKSNKTKRDYEKEFNSKLNQKLETYGQPFLDTLPKEFFSASVDWKLVYLYKQTQKKNDAFKLILEKFDDLKNLNNRLFEEKKNRGKIKDYSTDFESEWMNIILEQLAKVNLNEITDVGNYKFLYPLVSACKYFMKKAYRSKENKRKLLKEGSEEINSSFEERSYENFVEMDAAKQILENENPLLLKIFERLLLNPSVQTKQLAIMFGESEYEISRKKRDLFEILQREGFIASKKVGNLSDRQIKILELKTGNPKIKQREIASILECDEFSISRDMKHLRNLGFLEKKE